MSSGSKRSAVGNPVVVGNGCVGDVVRVLLTVVCSDGGRGQFVG